MREKLKQGGKNGLDGVEREHVKKSKIKNH
jgi:hypothetical protein